MSAPYKPVDLSRHEGRTPGAWREGRPDTSSLDGCGYSKSVYVDDIRGGYDRLTGLRLPLEVGAGFAPESEEAHANARLIADAPALRDEVVALREALAVFRKDHEDAAGELLLPLPEPGSDISKMFRVRRHLLDRIEALEADNRELRAALSPDAGPTCVACGDTKEVMVEWSETGYGEPDENGEPTPVQVRYEQPAPCPDCDAKPTLEAPK